MCHEPRHPDDRDDPAPEVPRRRAIVKKTKKPWLLEGKSRKPGGIAFGFFKDWTKLGAYETWDQADQARRQKATDTWCGNTLDLRVVERTK